MNNALFVSLVSFALVSSTTPGPNNLLLMSSGALFGWRRTLPHLGGVLLGFAILMTCCNIRPRQPRWPMALVHHRRTCRRCVVACLDVDSLFQGGSESGSVDCPNGIGTDLSSIPFLRSCPVSVGQSESNHPGSVKRRCLYCDRRIDLATCNNHCRCIFPDRGSRMQRLDDRGPFVESVYVLRPICALRQRHYGLADSRNGSDHFVRLRCLTDDS